MTASRVDTLDALVHALEEASFDVSICDISMPSLTTLEALAAVRATGRDVPFIVVSGTVSEEVAVQTMKAGANDYISKHSLARLGPAVDRELRDAADRAGHREAERLRARAEGSFRALIESLPDLVMVVRDGTLAYVNTVLVKALGYPSSASLLGKPPSSLVAENMAATVDERVKAAMSAPIPLQERLFVRMDGSLLAVEVWGSPVEFDGGPAVVAMARDITERKRLAAEARASEDRFRALVGSMKDTVYTLDAEQRYTGVYGGHRHVSQCVVGKSARELLTPSVAAVHEREQSRALAGEPVLFDWSRDDAGTPVHYETVLSPLRNEAGKVVGLVGVTRDVTVQKNTIAQLLLADRLAALGGLAAGLAHEINNPLAALLLNLEMMTRVMEGAMGGRVDGVELQESLADSCEAAARVRDIVRDVKLFARAGDETRALVDVRTLLDSAVRLAVAELRDKADVVKEYGDVPLVRASEARLGQVFLNLLVNAAQATPAGRPAERSIRLVTRQDEASVIVEIIDAGGGIPPEVLARLFTPFFTTKPAGIGTGLGLSISHTIVHELGGSIVAESSVGRGTTFRVRLPVPAGASLPAASREPGPRSRGTRRRILVVDDDAALIRSVHRMLATEHDVVSEAYSSRALERLVGGERYDVIVCDLMMPGLDGAALHEALALAAPDQAARMAFVSAAPSLEMRRFLDRSARPWLEKPFSVDALLRMIDAVEPGLVD